MDQFVTGPIVWEEAEENNSGIKTIAFQQRDYPNGFTFTDRVGYNGMLKGDHVLFEGRPYTIVMVSRLGDLGLSETDQLPYTLRVSIALVQPAPPEGETHDESRGDL